MLRKEWSLIVNSIVIQLACGLFTYLAIYRYFLTGQAGLENALMMTVSAMQLVGPLIAAGMVLSLFHLGRPLRALRAVTRMQTSWLSREVCMTGAFLAFWILSTWLDVSGAENSIPLWLTVVAGWLCVLSMTGIYVATGKPGWSAVNTGLSFFGTLIIFGGAGSAAVAGFRLPKTEILPNLEVLFILPAFLILIVRYLYQLKILSSLKSGTRPWSLDQLVAAAPLPLSGTSVRLYQRLTLWGGWLSFGGVALAFYVLTAGKAVTVSSVWIAVALLVLTGEALQRAGFVGLGLSGETEGRIAG